MSIDIISPGWVPFEYLAISQNVPGWIKAHDQVLAYQFERIIAGHFTRLGTRQDAVIQQGYIRDLEAASREAIETVKFEEFIPRVKDPSNPWAVYIAYLDIPLNGPLMPHWPSGAVVWEVRMFSHPGTPIGWW